MKPPTIPLLSLVVTTSLVVGCAGAEPGPTKPASVPARAEALELRRGVAVSVDGRAAPGEWDDAGTLAVDIAPGWSSTIRYKHDGSNLLVAFANLGSPATGFVYPEVVLDAKNDGGLVWGADDWWFHASWADCWSHGSYNDYASCTSGATPPFQANNYTDQRVAPEWIEVQIPLSAVQLTPSSSFRLGFVLTDTKREYTLWPARAQLGIPASWADARAVP